MTLSYLYQSAGTGAARGCLMYIALVIFAIKHADTSEVNSTGVIARRLIMRAVQMSVFT